LVDDVIKIPIAHGQGNYNCDENTLKELEKNGQVVARYCDPEGNVTEEANVNGSLNNIAAVSNVEGTVLGIMPHPERVSNKLIGQGSEDGRQIFQSIISYLD